MMTRPVVGAMNDTPHTAAVPLDAASMLNAVFVQENCPDSKSLTVGGVSPALIREPAVRFGIVRPPYRARYAGFHRRTGVSIGIGLTTPFFEVASTVNVCTPGPSSAPMAVTVSRAPP